MNVRAFYEVMDMKKSAILVVLCLGAILTGCGKVDSDPDRFGTSARRQTTQEGILADTNNSTNDFLRSSKPSFME